MSFMDPKEEVIDIELTQYGKYLLSKGNFKPVFYAFYDDNILYDTQYAGFAEGQNSAEERIKAETPQPTAQYIFHGVETEITKINETIRSGQNTLGSERIQPTSEKFFSLVASLGNSSLESSVAPSFSIKYLQGELSGSVPYLSSSYQKLPIPQLSSSVVYKTFVAKEIDPLPEEIGEDGEVRAFLNENTHIFQDGTFLKVEPNSLILQVDELNTPFERENYDIEVFLRETIPDNNILGNTKEQYIPLSFVKRRSNISSNLLLNEKQIEENFPDLDSTYVEYFLDINVDGEIDREEFCIGLAEEQQNNIYADRTIDCTEKIVEKRVIKDIFKTNVKDIEDCE